MESQSQVSTRKRHDVIVIGGGSAGYAAARTARDAGADVAIVDQGPLGGFCILRGCMPTKAILRSAEVVFTDPQVAVLGLNETCAKAGEISYLTASYPFVDHGKALCLGATQGFAKLLAASQTGEILGAQIVGPEAGELIHELIAVMYYHGTVADLLRMPHYHPTLAEIVTYPAESIVERLGA
ncbi:MAG: FAD-dependent oxidoreductase [Nitrospirae bacterium]|nr:FAD-dependent oxidoreductase [Nitrospirota bacterium]